jgi:pimeloyl-ACP methyl ester carboxylesterase
MEQVGDLMTTLSLSESATPVARAFVRSFYLAIAAESYVSLANAIIHSEVPDFAAVKVPLLVMDAEEDSGGLDHSLNGCQSVYEGWGGRKEFVVVKQAGHWHVVEQPEQVVDFIAKFLSGL